MVLSVAAALPRFATAISYRTILPGYHGPLGPPVHEPTKDFSATRCGAAALTVSIQIYISFTPPEVFTATVSFINWPVETSRPVLKFVSRTHTAIVFWMYAAMGREPV